MQPADIAIDLRRRSPWEATDLGFTMLRRWWRPVYAAHALVFVPLVLGVIAAGWAAGMLWLAMLVVWWLEPLYDRVVLHVLSRAVFGAVPGWKEVLSESRQWLRTSLPWALTFDRFDLARSFNLPVRQLEGSRGREGRTRKLLLGRRTRGYAVWLTVVWIHFEMVLIGSAAGLAGLLLPAQAERARDDADGAFGGLLEFLGRASLEDALVYAAVVFLLEPFFVAAGFALYLNRRTLLEGWDIEVALRRIGTSTATVLLAVAIGLLPAGPLYSQENNAKQEIAEVLKAKDFGYEREVERWRLRPGDFSSWFGERKPDQDGDASTLIALGQALARAAEVLLWIAAGALVGYALWWAARMLPRFAAAREAPYQPPAALFGMELAPETLPPDVPAAAAALAREGNLREALGLLYRGALSELVHKRGVRLAASHTEGEAVRLAALPYFAALVEAWRQCAYARRAPSAADVERLAAAYREAFA